MKSKPNQCLRVFFSVGSLFFASSSNAESVLAPATRKEFRKIVDSFIDTKKEPNKKWAHFTDDFAQCLAKDPNCKKGNVVCTVKEVLETCKGCKTSAEVGKKLQAAKVDKVIKEEIIEEYGWAAAWGVSSKWNKAMEQRIK